MLLVVIAVSAPGFAPAISDESPKGDNAAAPKQVRLAGPKTSAQMVLAATEAFVRPSARDDQFRMVLELEARGLTEASRRLKEQLANTDDDFERLTRTLIAHRALGAAQAVLSAWGRKPGRPSPKHHFLAAAAHFAGGEFELCLRDLERAAGAPGMDPGVAKLMRSIADAERRGVRIGVDQNPWNARMDGSSGKFEPGRISESELKKIDPDACEQVAGLLQLFPLQANLWGLFGDLLNGAGDVHGAAGAYRRAESLGYTPRPLLERRRSIENYLREQQSKSEQPTSSGRPDATRADQGMSNESKAWIVGVGVAVVAGLAALQIREWFRKFLRK